MAATQFRLQIVSGDRSLVNEMVDEVEIPGSEGYFGVLVGHTPLLALLGVGELWYRQGTTKQYLLIAAGFAEVQPDHVTILAETAEHAHEIDVARAEAAKQRAEHRLSTAPPELDYDRAHTALVRALIRLQVATRAGVRG